MTVFAWPPASVARPEARFPTLQLISATALALIAPWVLGKAMQAALPQILADGPAWLDMVAQALAVSPFLGIARMILGLPLAVQMIRLGWFGWGSALLCGIGLGGLTAVMSGYPAELPISALTMVLMQRFLVHLCRWRKNTDTRSAQQDG